MTGLLEVICLHEADARRAEEGGADRIELVGSMDDGGYSPEPRLVEKVRSVTTIPLRPMVRLRAGFATDGGEFTRLQGLVASYVNAGCDGVVFGFLNGRGDVDIEVCTALASEGTWPWTFHRAIDHVLETDRAWDVLPTLPRLDQVLTAGSARSVEFGLDDLLARARRDPVAARLMLVGGGLAPEHVPWLVKAGVRAFHIGAPARPGRSFKAYVDAPLVHTWRTLIDDEVRHDDDLRAR